MNTKYTRPRTNIFSALSALTSALQNGHKAILIKMKNEDCGFPIYIGEENVPFKLSDYKLLYGNSKTRNDIINSTDRDRYKELSLNYKSMFGTPESIKIYQETGVLTKCALLHIGTSHIVKVSDMIKLLSKGDKSDLNWARALHNQYFDPDYADTSFFFDTFVLKDYGSILIPKKFKRKLWVVAILDKNENDINSMSELKHSKVLIKIFNILSYPLKFIPKKSVLRMDNYTVYGFRIGDVTNGYEMKFQIPKKFSFSYK